MTPEQLRTVGANAYTEGAEIRPGCPAEHAPGHHLAGSGRDGLSSTASTRCPRASSARSGR